MYIHIDPLTGRSRFMAGDRPADTHAEGGTTQEGTFPTAERGGNIHGGWTHPAGNGLPFVPVAGGNADGKGGQVLAVTDVLGVTSLDVKDSHQQVGNFGPEAASTNDGPRGQGGTGAPRG
jgi:hypothetical protein